MTAALTPQPETIDLGGSWRAPWPTASIPGPLIRANVGDELAVTVTNRLDHADVGALAWHRVAQRHGRRRPRDRPTSTPARSFTYRFSVPHPGTYWAHPHTGLDADYGLYLPVIVDDPREPGDYDAEWIVVLDDWTDGIGKTPQQIYDDLHGKHMPGMGGMGGMSGVGNSALLGGDAGDISYPYYLVNGRIPSAPTTFTAKPGQRIRIRIINAGSDTAFRVALAGHTMTVTHTDGYPVLPTEVDAVLMGMGERYDVIVTAGDGVFPLVASAEGKNALARALLSTGAGTSTRSRVSATPSSTGGSAPSTCSPPHRTSTWDRPNPMSTCSANLSGGMMHYDWAINGAPYAKNQPLTDQSGTTGDADLYQHDDDVAPDAPARAHLPDHQPGRHQRCPQRHHHRAAHAKSQRRPASRQSRHLDDALPQHVSPRSRDDDQPQLHHLTRHRPTIKATVPEACHDACFSSIDSGE